MDSATDSMDCIQGENFISETVGLLILNELRIMRRDLKSGLMKLETKVDAILCACDDDTIENSASNWNQLDFGSDAIGEIATKNLDFSQSEEGSSANTSQEATGSAIDVVNNEVYTIKIDVNELPDDISLESYDEEDDVDTIASNQDPKPSRKISKDIFGKNSKKSKHQEEGSQRLGSKLPYLQTMGGRYQCTLCPSSFTKKGNLRRHYRYHTNDKRYTCRVCWKKFYRRECLFAHIRRHSDEELSKASPKELGEFGKIHTCPFCNRAFSLSTNLKRHIRLHTGEKPYSCPFCQEKFIRDDTLKRHIIKKHSELLQ